MSVLQQHGGTRVLQLFCSYAREDREGVRALLDGVKRVGAERVIFGSDGPGCNPRLEVEKVRMLGLGRDAEGLILGGNATRLLGLEEAAG
jgi:predicted TIM-barrel fold metal-dependent hydrolase